MQINNRTEEILKGTKLRIKITYIYIYMSLNVDFYALYKYCD